MSSLTAVVLTKNNESILAACLECLQFCQQIIVIDSNSSDRTREVAEQYNCRVINYDAESFAKKREKALDLVKTEWLLYIDSDERVSPQLAEAILAAIATNQASALSFSRENICYGYSLNHGGWDQDVVTRVFRKKDLRGWQGEIHESPLFTGSVQVLQQKLLHLTHRNTQDNLRKSADWTIKEAELLAKAKAAPVTLGVIVRKGVMEFYRRAWQKKGYRDGLPGLIEALVQGMNRMLVYIQLWELQQKPSLIERYQQQEEKIARTWQQSRLKKT